MESCTAQSPLRSHARRYLRGGMIAAIALTLLGCEDDPGLVFQHDSVKLEFRRGDGVDSNPFVGTTVMELTLNYEKCLIDFYEANSNWRAVGPDGDTVFGPRDLGGEGWKDELCERGDIACEVISFTQNFDTATGNRLTVQYAISGEIENRTIHFGPLPLRSLAGCEGGGDPTVRVSNTTARGLNGLPPDGEILWQVQKFNPSVAVAGQGQSINIDGEPK